MTSPFFSPIFSTAYGDVEHLLTRSDVFSTDIFTKTSTEIPHSLPRRRCLCYNFYNQLVPYADALKWQRSMVEMRSVAVQRGEDVDDAVLLLQHPPVYTLGTQSSEEYLLFDREKPPCEVYQVERGGEVTYHGPGQLVMYPILNLRHQQMDLHWYLRSLEEIVIRALQSGCAVEARRIKGLTGVWVGDMKVAAIGIRVSRWITYHGLALNVTTDLSPFKRIIPCGISDRPVGSVLDVLRNRTVSESIKVGSGYEDEKISYHNAYLLNLLQKSLLMEFSNLFQLDLAFQCQISWDIDSGMSSVNYPKYTTG